MNDADRLNAKPDESYQTKIWTMNKLATYFGIAKADLKQDIDFSEKLMFVPMLSDRHNLNVFFHCVRMNPKHLSLSFLFNGAKVEKSRLYEEFVIGEEESSGDWDSYIMTLHFSDKDVYVVRREEQYNGYGGIFVKIPGDTGLVIEPIASYLRAHFPKDGEELV